MQRLSRRDFIKLIFGAGLGFGIALTGLDRVALLSNATNTKKGSNLLTEASAFHPAGGTWESRPNSQTVGIHAAYLWTGKIIMVEGSSFNKTNSGQPPIDTPLKAEVYDPILAESGAQDYSNLITMGYFPADADLFCCYQAQLPDGNILFAGGTKMYSSQHTPLNCGDKWAGSKNAYKFNYITETMESVQPMTEGRWYPTLVCLANGNVAAFSGNDSWGGGSDNQLVEVYDWQGQTWTNPHHHANNPPDQDEYEPDDGDCTTPIPASYSAPPYSISPPLGEYPRCHLIPANQDGDTTGVIAIVGADSNTVRTWNPSNGLWNFMNPSGAILDRFNGPTFLLPLENQIQQTAKILVAGGGIGSNNLASGNSQLYTFNSPSSVTLDPTIPAMNFPRKYPSQIILPDGKCVVFGGTDNNQGGESVGTPEYIDPSNLGAGWHSFSSTPVLRTYHSTAVLLADGSVLTAGGTTTSGLHLPPTTSSLGSKTIQVFKPPYFAQSRPTITSITGIGGYGGTMQINTPDAQQIENAHGVSLVKLDAITHHFGANQRLVWLPIVSGSRTSTSLLAQMPVSGVLAPPGYYMVFVLKSGIPSKTDTPRANIVRIGYPDQTTPLLTILTPAAGEIVSGPSGGFPLTVQGQASDAGSGIQKVDVRIGNSNPVPATPSPTFGDLWTADVDVTTQGPTMIQATATDNSQNTSAITIPIRIVFS